MMVTVEAQIDENGNVKLLQPISVPSPRRALVIILDEPSTLPSAAESEDGVTEQELLAEDEVWAKALERHAERFGKLKAQAKADVEAGRSSEMFSDDGEFVVK